MSIISGVIYKLKTFYFAKRAKGKIEKKQLLKTIKIGGYSAWTIPDGVLNEKSNCYSVGVGENVDFDLNLIKTYYCNIYAFDPTPRAIEFVNKAVRHEKFHFNPVAIWTSDASIKFFAPKNPSDVSYSITNLQQTQDFIEVPCRKLSTMLRELGHDHVDIIKLNIEGAEYDVIDSIIQENLDVRLICAGFHFEVKKSLTMITRLLNHQYRLISVNGWDCVFISKIALDKQKMKVK